MSYFDGGYFGPYFDPVVVSTLGRHVRGRQRSFIEDIPDAAPPDHVPLIVLLL
jgi:hypothetical protein